MPPTDPTIVDANKHLLASVEEQIRDLQLGLQKRVEIAIISTELNGLKTTVSSFSDAALDQELANIINKVTAIESEIQAGQKTLSDFGEVLVKLYVFQQSLENKLQEWLGKLLITDSDKENIETILLRIIIRVRQLLTYRPDVNAIMDDLSVMKNLRGGPADATSFHDFQVLQLAFKSVWMHVFDEDLKSAVETAYATAVEVYNNNGLAVPNFDAINDIDDLYDFINDLKKVIDSSYEDNKIGPSQNVSRFIPDAARIWNLLSDEQKGWIEKFAGELRGNHELGLPIYNLADNWEAVRKIIENPQGRIPRLAKLIFEIGKYLSEPYAFNIFAPNSYNFGLMITYRQKWDPGEYQAGELVATIPLAPGETRKFSKKQIVKKSRAEKEIERSMSSRSSQSSETSRAEAEIMKKATTATNFKMTAQGSFRAGIGNIDASTEFLINQELQSALNKKEFHEATIKAAEEYKLERSLEVDTTLTMETEEISTGEISNPNNEITVTYLFYELQRRFKIHEFLYRVRPVILVAQDVPAPHEIDEAWLIQYQWIISRVLLDDSLRPALDYLTSGLAGDEVSIEILKAHWESQASLVQALEGQVRAQLVTRSSFRDDLTQQALRKSLEEARHSTARDIFLGVASHGLSTLFGNPLEGAETAEAHRQAAETRLEYAEEALADAQEKLKQATLGFEQATKEYAAAMQNQYTRHVAIDQLRVHIKQNILYYLQAIWDHEPPDQRFFRLYNLIVACPQPPDDCKVQFTTDKITGEVTVKLCPPAELFAPEVPLVEVADLDNPLGYKGNYIIFPMKGECYLTTYMLKEFIHDYLGVRDPDAGHNFDAEKFDQEWNAAAKIQDPKERQKRQTALREDLVKYITAVRRSTDGIIVPTGQLFIQALPGSHPLLEDFKLMHRFEDVRKVKAEVRHAELENLRLAARLVAGQENQELLDDPDVEKTIVVDGKTGVIVPP